MNLRGFLAAAALIGLTAVPASAAAPSNDCRFVLGFAALRDLAGANVVGDCLEDGPF